MWPQCPCSGHSGKHCRVSAGTVLCSHIPQTFSGNNGKSPAVACVSAPNLCSQSEAPSPPNSLTGNCLDVCSSLFFGSRSPCDNPAVTCKSPLKPRLFWESFLGFPRGSSSGFRGPQLNESLALNLVSQGPRYLHGWSLTYCVDSLPSGEPWKMFYFILTGTEQKLVQKGPRSPVGISQRYLCKTGFRWVFNLKLEFRGHMEDLQEGTPWA